MTTTTSRGSSAGRPLRLPQQAAPVYRTFGGAALNGGQGVEASGWFDDVISAVKDYGPLVAKGLSAIV
jgi:hypothetical protein